MSASILRFLAFDLGAESGRAMLGTLADNHISLEEIHRFPTQGIVMLGTRQWDVTRMYGEMLQALRIYVRAHGPHLDGIGVDTWGVDFGLVARDGSLLGNPVHYRDRRNEGAMDAAFGIVPRDQMYAMTGIQFLPFNTAFQLLAMKRGKSSILDTADKLLLMGDLFGYLLSGQRACEYTNASTTQLLDPWKRTWNDELISALGLPRDLLLDPVPPGTVLGTILPGIADATGLDPAVKVIAPATHDTGAAVAAVPVTDRNMEWAYLSSGTWSLLGVELPQPLVTEESCAANFTNEGGVGGNIRFLKNIIGLWLVQECRRVWARSSEVPGYAELMKEAEAARSTAIIDVDDSRLLVPDDMPATIRNMAAESGDSIPQARGEVLRCALESLAQKYRRTLAECDRLLGRKTRRLHIIGGGVQNRLLCRMTAETCGIDVSAGPVEATALGNIVTQAMGIGAIGSLDEARRIIAESFEPVEYKPGLKTEGTAR